jgi:vacuolar-type H+-ATPase subunit D/Vma8
LLAKQAEWSAKQAELSARLYELQMLASQRDNVAQKAINLMRDSVLDVLAEQFTPSVVDYRRVVAQLQKITDLEALRELLQEALRAADFAAFAQTLQDHLESTD